MHPRNDVNTIFYIVLPLVFLAVIRDSFLIFVLRSSERHTTGYYVYPTNIDHYYFFYVPLCCYWCHGAITGFIAFVRLVVVQSVDDDGSGSCSSQC